MAKAPRWIPFLFALPLLGAAGLCHAAGDAGACSYVPTAKLKLHLSETVPMPVVDGSINGKPARLLLSTGSFTTQLTRSATDRLGIGLRESSQYALGLSGTARLYNARLSDFSVGQFHNGPMVLPVIGASDTPLPYDALVGADSLLRMDMEIALADKLVRFFRADGCDNTFLAYWDKDAMEIPFGGTELVAYKPRFIVELNGKKLEAAIGTGSPRTVVTRAAAESIGVRIDSPGVASAGSVNGVGGGKVARWIATFDTFTLGSETIQNAQLSILDTPPQGDLGAPDIILGDDFLHAHRVLIAMSQRRLYVSYVGGAVFSK